MILGRLISTSWDVMLDPVPSHTEGRASFPARGRQSNVLMRRGVGQQAIAVTVQCFGSNQTEHPWSVRARMSTSVQNAVAGLTSMSLLNLTRCARRRVEHKS